MKKRDTILLLGISSIIILITAQVIIIKGVWQQKDEMLYLRYSSLSQEAVATLRGRRLDVYDTVRFILNKYSEQVVKELPEIKDEQKLIDRKKEIFEYFSKVLNQEQDLTGVLSSYFEKMGFEKFFNHRIEITKLDIIGLDTFKIYQSDTFRNRRYFVREGIASALKGSKSSILVIRPSLVDNYYALSFDFYIDFSDKQKMILKETSVSLGMSIFSIMVVVIIFLVTYRNLKEEKRLSDLKTDFINNMTHELKTPLSTITVAGKTLEMERIRTDESKILETAKLINKQSIHLNQLINLILEISIWERTQFQLDKKIVRVDELIYDIVESFKTGGGNNAKISLDCNLDGITTSLDVVYFTTMINNLLTNAVKYSNDEPVVHIECYKDNDNIYIKIEDNGIGISRADQKHIFDKFYRVLHGNIHKIKGMGLGLYYVKRIAEAHGGNANVSSRIGKGSTFTITLPC
jgi:signal transduction histidine kinase